MSENRHESNQNQNGVLLEVVDLHKSFGSQVILNGIDVQIPEGGITFILGPSGTGKSVFLKHIIGLLKPDSGHIYMEGKDLVSLSQVEMNEVRKRMGVLFQNAALFDSLTVFENVAFPLVEHTNMNKREIEERVHEKLELVGLSGVDEKYPSQLSGGMRKRVGLARAIVMNPKIILYDEPTTGLDPLMLEQINELIANTNRAQNASSIIISHDIKAMVDIADYACVLYKGKIVAKGTPSQILASEHPFVRKFIQTGLSTNAGH